MQNNKKTVLYASNPSFWGSTGFSKHAKTLLLGLYKTGKYNIIELCCNTHDDDPQLKKSPWKSYGVYRKEHHGFITDLRNKNDQAALEIISRGSLVIDDIIQKEKVDVAIFTEDIWQLGHWTLEKPWWNKITSVIWTPVDSKPMLPIFHKYKDKFKNLWVKANFAKTELNNIGIDAKLMSALILIDNFHPLADNDRNTLRKNLGLDDKFVIGFVFRNQLRKLVVSLLEAFKEFKSKNPEAPAKLLLHTNWQEGWNIPEAIRSLGIDHRDILTTYVCNNCRQVSIMPWVGPDQNCGGCGTQKSLNNPTFTNGVTEKDLNAIYNVMDAYVHLCTSGGLEFPMVESMLAGVPNATCNYSFGEDFVGSGFTEPVDFTFYREGTSFFLKSQPDIKSAANVIEKIYKNPEHYKEIAKKAREWALQTFDNQMIIDKVAKFIDESSHNYSFMDSSVQKNTIESFILPSENKKMLFVMSDNSDACFASLPVIEELHKVYSDYDFYLSVHPQFIEIFNHLNYIKNIIPYTQELDNFMQLEGAGNNKGLFDLVFHPCALTSKFPSFHHNGEDRNCLQPEYVL